MKKLLVFAFATMLFLLAARYERISACKRNAGNGGAIKNISIGLGSRTYALVSIDQ